MRLVSLFLTINIFLITSLISFSKENKIVEEEYNYKRKKTGIRRYKVFFYRKSDGTIYKIEKHRKYSYHWKGDMCGGSGTRISYRPLGTWKYFDSKGTLMKKEKYKKGILVE